MTVRYGTHALRDERHLNYRLAVSLLRCEGQPWTRHRRHLAMIVHGWLRLMDCPV
jgi:hypothetical protein